MTVVFPSGYFLPAHTPRCLGVCLAGSPGAVLPTRRVPFQRALPFQIYVRPARCQVARSQEIYGCR